MVALVVLFAVMVAVIAATIAVTMASRKIPVQIPRKVMGRGRIREGQKSFVPLRLNSAGVMPIIFAQSIIIVPGTLATFSAQPWMPEFRVLVRAGDWLYYIAVRGADPLLHLLLHGDHLQSGRSGGEPEEAGRVRPGREARRAHGGVHRPGADADLASWLALPGGDRDASRSCFFDAVGVPFLGASWAERDC